MSSRQEAESAAAMWIGRREGGRWTPADQAALDAWVAASLHNRVAWLRLNAAWETTARLKTLQTGESAGAVAQAGDLHVPFCPEPRNEKPSGRSHPRLSARLADRAKSVHWGALLASVLLIGVLAATRTLLPSGHAYETGIGALEAIPLADGSRVMLNTNTRLRVDLTQDERLIDLARGEAYFEVAKDPARPFVVHAGDKRIIAVGTHFSVRTGGDGVRVWVTEGTVRIEQSEAGAARPIAQLPCGAIAHALGDSVVVQTKPVAEVEQLLSWRSGYLSFDRTPLAAAIAEFNRYNRRQIAIADPQVAAIRIGGHFRATNIDAFLRLLASDFPVVASEQGDRIVLTGFASAPQ